MNKIDNIRALRKKLQEGQYSVGSWMQIPHPSIAEILGKAGYDWVAVDLEHGAVSIHQLPDLFRALELGGTLPLVRLAQGEIKDCKQALDAGATGVIIPMIESAQQLEKICHACCWPPAGSRGVGFSRANLFGYHFESYKKEAQEPLIIAMIESRNAVHNLDEILQVKGLDAILIGPYDLSASLGLTAQFQAKEFIEIVQQVQKLSKKYHVPYGIHVVNPEPNELRQRIDEGYQFIAYSIDAVFLNHAIRTSQLF